MIAAAINKHSEHSSQAKGMRKWLYVGHPRANFPRKILNGNT